MENIIESTNFASKVIIEKSVIKYNKTAWIKDMLRKSTPVARRWAIHCLNNGIDFSEIEDDIFSICTIEDRLYNTVKETLIHHISLHGLDKKTDELFTQFKELKYFNRNVFSHFLSRVNRAYVNDEENRYLGYFITKLHEFINKLDDFVQVAFEMLKNGKNPDLDEWSIRIALQDALFEENKQFLRQALNHLRVLEVNKYPLGVADIRMLLYHRQGCLRYKLYRETESWIIKIYEKLPEGDEKIRVYEEICEFIAEVVPLIGYISHDMIKFILNYDYMSKITRDLLFKIKPTIDKLGMVSLFKHPLKRLIKTCEVAIEKSDEYAMSYTYLKEISQLYFPQAELFSEN